jgi:hypothetical protein
MHPSTQSEPCPEDLGSALMSFLEPDKIHRPTQHRPIRSRSPESKSNHYLLSDQENDLLFHTAFIHKDSSLQNRVKVDCALPMQEYYSATMPMDGEMDLKAGRCGPAALEGNKTADGEFELIPRRVRFSLPQREPSNSKPRLKSVTTYCQETSTSFASENSPARKREGKPAATSSFAAAAASNSKALRARPFDRAMRAVSKALQCLSSTD